MIDSVVCGTVVTLCTSQAAAGLSDNYFKKWWPCFKFGVQAWVIAIFSATRVFRVKLPGSGPARAILCLSDSELWLSRSRY